MYLKKKIIIDPKWALMWGMEVGCVSLFSDRLVTWFTHMVYLLSERLCCIGLIWKKKLDWSVEDEACCHRLWWRLSDSPKEDTSVDGSPRCTRWLQSVNIPLTQCVRTLWGLLDKTDLKNFLWVGQGENGIISNSEQRAPSHSEKRCSARAKALFCTPDFSPTETKSGFNDMIRSSCPGKDLVW